MLKDKDRKSIFKFAELVATVHESHFANYALRQKNKDAHVRDEVCRLPEITANLTRIAIPTFWKPDGS